MKKNILADFMTLQLKNSDNLEDLKQWLVLLLRNGIFEHFKLVYCNTLVTHY